MTGTGTMTMTGTLFGYRKGHMHWALQHDTRSAPGLLLELATPTSTLVREMASGMVRIALECPKAPCHVRPDKLLDEPAWTMYCNGRKSGFARRLGPGSYSGSWHAAALSMLAAVSMGAGVLPLSPRLSSPRTAKNLIDTDKDTYAYTDKDTYAYTDTDKDKDTYAYTGTDKDKDTYAYIDIDTDKDKDTYPYTDTTDTDRDEDTYAYTYTTGNVDGVARDTGTGTGNVDGVARDQLMYMRARFERVVGNCDSEAYYMMNPDRTSSGGPELSIFLLRV